MVKVINNEKEIKAIDHIQQNNLPCLLLWETWTGKTTLVKHLADKYKRKLTRINLNWQTGREDLIGKYILKGWNLERQDWPLSIAIKEWHWILLDEINAALPEVLFTIQALTESVDNKLWDLLLAEKDWEILTPHEDTRIFATANPADRYIWAKAFNPATLSRFVVIQVNPLSDADEVKVLESRYPKLDKWDMAKLIEIMSRFRQKDSEGESQFEYFCSTRDIVNTAWLIVSGLGIKDSVTIGILNKVQSNFEKKEAQSLINSVLKVSKKDATAKMESFLKAREEYNKIKSDYELGEKKIEELRSQNEWLVNDVTSALKEKEEAIKQVEKYKALSMKAKEVVSTFTKAASLFDTVSSTWK